MSKVVIKAENISKQYRLGLVGTGTVKDDMKRWWYNLRGKEDPFLKIGEANDRSSKGESDYVWSLRDINFEINQGDSVGIIGRNGAGKSTLLKILSQVTQPTTGKIYTKGRIASLLEVGTGFHPEMTGRENIYLNGAILGMRKHEITRKLDEIIAFSGVERYIDTPVKRYSSGMYVRLAFAVAAHLESEILIVDEVLAVGDAEFQKKCLGKMNDVSKGEGRTVLFVSHNMAAVSDLCKSSILLENGVVITHDNTIEVINKYIRNNNSINFKNNYEFRIDLNDIQISNVAFNNQSTREIELNQGDVLVFSFDINNDYYKELDFLFNIELKTIDGTPIGCFGNEFQNKPIKLNKGKCRIELMLGECGWNKGEYSFNFYCQLGLGLSLNSAYVEDFLLVKINDCLVKGSIWNQFINKKQHGHVPILWSYLKKIDY